MDNIWEVDLPSFQLINKYKKGMRFSSCAIKVFTKYEGVALLGNKKGQGIGEKSKHCKRIKS